MATEISPISTPGFNTRITIKLIIGSSGRPRAFRWSPNNGMRHDCIRPDTGRWLQMQLAEAKLLVEQDHADRYDANNDL